MTLATTLHPLSRASGSATYSSPSSKLSILGAVNFPLEVPRRSDEIPTALLIEVNVRPHDGVSMVKERHLESLVKKTLQATVLVEDYPRALMQVGLQILRAERSADEGSSLLDGYLGILSGLINAASLAALDAVVGLREVFVAVLVGVKLDGQILIEPTIKDRGSCQSLHVFCFGGTGKMLLAESEGRFTIDKWEQVQAAAKETCVGLGSSSDVVMNGSSTSQSLLQGVRAKLEQRVISDQRWRGG